MKLPCVGETRAPPIARALETRRDRPARRPTTECPSGTAIARRLRILEDAAGARRLERLRPLAKRQRLARGRRAAPPGRPRATRNAADSSDLAACACRRLRVVAELHVGRPATSRSVARRGRRAARSSTRSPMSAGRRSARCRRSRRRPCPACPPTPRGRRTPCVIVQRTRPLIVTAASARTRPVADRARSRRRAAGCTRPRTPRVGDRARSIRRRASSPARRASRASCSAPDDLVARSRLDQPVGRSADPERRERRERHVAPHALGAERACKRRARSLMRRILAAHRISSRSRAMSAASASARVHDDELRRSRPARAGRRAACRR